MRALSGFQTGAPFVRLRDLLDGINPPVPPVSLALGEPGFAVPQFVLNALADDTADYGRYPPIEGIPEWYEAVRGWLTRRFRFDVALLSEPPQILPLNGTREGLFLAAQLAPEKENGLMAMPNPFYQTYAMAAQVAGAEPIFLPADAATGFLPDLSVVTPDILMRLRVLYLCSPANPQGAVADTAYLAKALALADEYNFILLVDECYTEIYDRDPPPSMLQIMATQGADNAPVMVFHSLSKRSNLPGLRSGFCAGGRTLMQRFLQLRQMVAPQSPLAVQRAAALAWSDDAHVEANRVAYRANFDAADDALTGQFNYFRPEAGFFLWLNVGDGEAAARHLWRKVGLRVLPGAYLTMPDSDGHNIAAAYIRVALVARAEQVRAALGDLVETLASWEGAQ